MTILDFDDIEKYQEVRTWLTSMTPSQLMERKQNVVDVVWDFLEYCYVLGLRAATEEVGQLAEDVKPFLPKDYDDLTDDEKKVADREIFRKFDNKDFQDRVNQYAELGNAADIIRVVETDGNRVYNYGGLNGATKAGAKYKTWETMMDEKVRDTHSFLEGIKVPIQDKFVTYDGDEADIPCGFSNPASNVNCRCWLTFSN